MQALVLSREFHRRVEGIPAILILLEVGGIRQLVGVIPVTGEPRLQIRQTCVQSQALIDNDLIPRLALLETGGLPQPGNGRVEGLD
jgi:hypothetical protein